MKGINLAEKNGMWKGNKVGLNALHEWIINRKPKSKLCECCKVNKPRDLANISNTYKRNIKDFEWLCRRCHMRKDGRMNNLRQGASFGKMNPNWKHGKFSIKNNKK